jgi:hypothetical protein
MRGRSIVVFALLAIWLSTPALACLPNPQMTQAEMDCCKKMAGDCSMGSGKHPCCKSFTTTPSPIPSVQAKVLLQPCFTLVALVPDIAFDLRAGTESSHLPIGLPPPAPPGTDSILRI